MYTELSYEIEETTHDIEKILNNNVDISDHERVWGEIKKDEFWYLNDYYLRPDCTELTITLVKCRARCFCEQAQKEQVTHENKKREIHFLDTNEIITDLPQFDGTSVVVCECVCNKKQLTKLKDLKEQQLTETQRKQNKGNKYLVKVFKINGDGTKQERAIMSFSTDDLEGNKHKHNINSEYVTEITERYDTYGDVYPYKKYYTRNGGETIRIYYRHGILMFNDEVLTNFYFLNLQMSKDYSCEISKTKGEELRLIVSSELLKEKDIYYHINKGLFSDVEPNILLQIEELLLETKKPLYDYMGRRIEIVDNYFFRAITDEQGGVKNA